MKNEVLEPTRRRFVPEVAPNVSFADYLGAKRAILGVVLGDIFAYKLILSASISTSNFGRHF